MFDMSTSQVFRRRLKEARTRRGWKQSDLSQRVTELGHPLDRATIAKIEQDKRGVTLDDAVALAAALDVPPFALLLGERDEEMELTPKLRVRTPFVAGWLAGTFPLTEADAETYREAGNLFSKAISVEWTIARFMALRDLNEQERKMVDAASAMYARFADDLEQEAARSAATDQAAAEALLRVAQRHREKATQLRARPEEEK